MTRFLLHAAVFIAGLIAIAWIGSGYVHTNTPALAVTCLIGVVYLSGALELLRYQRATQSLHRALNGLTDAPATLADWLDGIAAGLRQSVRLRVEGARIALPAPGLAPYLVGLLVLLGMLGTFLGMIATLRGTGIALENATDLHAIRASLAAPVKGLGFAFGTSVAGVAASAALGLLTALCRRDRQQATQQLDAHAVTTLRTHTPAYQREQERQWLQQQTECLPALADRLQAMTAAMTQQAQALHTQLTDSQSAFQQTSSEHHSRLAQAIEQTLQGCAAASAHAAGQAIQPVAEQTLLRLSTQSDAWLDDTRRAISAHSDTLAQSMQQRHDALTQAVTQQQQSLAQTIQEQQQTLSQAVQKQTDAQSQTLLQLQQTLSDAIRLQQQTLTDTTQQQAETQSQTLQHLQQALADTATQQLQTLTDTVQQQYQTLTEATRQHQQTLADAVQQQLQALSATVEQQQHALGAAVEQQQQTLSQAAEQQQQALTQSVTAQSLALTETARTQADALTQQVQQQLEGQSERFLQATDTVSRQWNDALSAQQAANQALLDALRPMLSELASASGQHASDLLDTLSGNMTRLTDDMATRMTQLSGDVSGQLQRMTSEVADTWQKALAQQSSQGIEQDQQRLTAWTGALERTAGALQSQWEQAGNAIADRQQALCDALAQTARDIAHRTSEQSSQTIAEVARLAQLASEAPRATTEVVAALQQQLADGLARDNAALEERSRLLASLGSLLDTVTQGSTAQRQAIEALVETAAGLLERTSSQLTTHIAAQASQLSSAATQVAVSATGVSDLGAAFGSAVEQFGQSNDKLLTQLATIESALDKSMARSDEQLAYYVAQAREIVDLSLLSQRQIMENLQQISAAPTTGSGAA